MARRLDEASQQLLKEPFHQPLVVPRLDRMECVFPAAGHERHVLGSVAYARL
jgi:hypothetical protein